MTSGLITAAKISACVVAAVPLYVFLGIGKSAAPFAEICLFLALDQVHAGIARVQRRRRLEHGIDKLKDVNAGIKAELTQARRTVVQVSTAFAQRGEPQEKKVVGELQMIEG